MSFYELMSKLIELNPKVKFNMNEPSLVPNPEQEIFCSEKPEKLILPEGFEYNEKNGITNKHTVNGSYMAIKISQLKELTTPISSQKYWNHCVREMVEEDESAEYDFYSLLYELKKLNPSLQFDVTNPAYSPNAFDTIYLTFNGKTELNLPKGFTYNKDKQEITNKHNTKSGNYLSVNLRNTAKMVEKLNGQVDTDKLFLNNKQLEKQYASSSRLKPIYQNLIPNISKAEDVTAFCFALEKLNPEMEITMSNGSLNSPFSKNTIFAKPKSKTKLGSYLKSAIKFIKREGIRLPDGYEQVKQGVFRNIDGIEFKVEFLSKTAEKHCVAQEDLKYHYASCDSLPNYVDKTNNQISFGDSL